MNKTIEDLIKTKDKLEGEELTDFVDYCKSFKDGIPTDTIEEKDGILIYKPNTSPNAIKDLAFQYIGPIFRDIFLIHKDDIILGYKTITEKQTWKFNDAFVTADPDKNNFTILFYMTIVNSETGEIVKKPCSFILDYKESMVFLEEQIKARLVLKNAKGIN